MRSKALVRCCSCRNTVLGHCKEGGGVSVRAKAFQVMRTEVFAINVYSMQLLIVSPLLIEKGIKDVSTDMDML